jgi:hypothetical protein
VLQRQCGLGYTSAWASKSFESVADKNRFFEQLGRSLQPQDEDNLSGLNDKLTAQEILDTMKL